jgi:hypothetical protein
MAPELLLSATLQVLLILGFGSLAIWAKPFAARAMASQNETWGFHFGEREVRGTVWLARLVGIAGVLIGMWSLVKS